MIGQHRLHPKCRVMAAGNLVTDRAIAHTQGTAMASRLNHYTMKNDYLAWLEWANVNNIDPRIISWIKFQPDSLHKMNHDSEEKTFPCQRTWAVASKIIQDEPSIDFLTKVRLAGAIGDGMAVSFATFTEIYQNLPTIKQILADPKNGWRVPTEPSEQYATTTLLSHNLTAENAPKIITAIERLPAEFQVITFRDVYVKSPELKQHPAIADWIARHASVIFAGD